MNIDSEHLNDKLGHLITMGMDEDAEAGDAITVFAGSVSFFELASADHQICAASEIEKEMW